MLLFTMKRSQISVEILFAVGFVVFIFIILLAFTMDRRYEMGKLEITLKEKAECYKISDLISGVFNAGIGTSITETLEYDAEVDTAEGSIFVGDDRFFCTFPVSAVSNPQGSVFNLSEGSIALNNTNGTVVIQNA